MHRGALARRCNESRGPTLAPRRRQVLELRGLQILSGGEKGSHRSLGGAELSGHLSPTRVRRGFEGLELLFEGLQGPPHGRLCRYVGDGAHV